MVSVISFLDSTSFLITAHLLASTYAFSFSISTFYFSILTLAANLSASILSFSASICLFLTYSSMIATCSAVSLSLMSPDSYLSLFFSRLSLFCCNMLLNSLISSRKDLGVVYTYRRYISYSFADNLFTLSKEIGMKLTMAFLIDSSPRSYSYRKRVATLNRASFGQGKYQSIIVLLTKAGNCLALLLKDYPTGEKQRDMCNFCLTLSIYQFQQLVLSLESIFPSSFTLLRIVLMISSFSSEVYS